MLADFSRRLIMIASGLLGVLVFVGFIIYLISTPITRKKRGRPLAR